MEQVFSTGHRVAVLGVAALLVSPCVALAVLAQDDPFLAKINPKPVPAASYSVSLAMPNPSGDGVFHEVEAVQGSLTFTRSGPARAESGKPFIIRYKRNALVTERTALEKVELLYRIDGGDVQHAMVADGYRDPGTGELVLSPVYVNIPDTATSRLSYWFRLTTIGGTQHWDRTAEAPYETEILPLPTTIVRFEPDWDEGVKGKLVAGTSFRLAYDIDRVKSRLSYLYRNDVPVWSALAHVSFDGGHPIDVPLTAVSRDDRGVAADVMVLYPVVKIPEGTRRMSLWFVGRDYVGKAYDSNLSENYDFKIAAPEEPDTPDARGN